ncbi:hypothetical protein EVAR_48922_1 [Eumeta japonica]|uniref:Uncharacterized protein n=1 Tax=Eumeta variegata TaxID=151549 RepID=A0A4C1YXW7_EUMVA|nr:hypothetical protein EVAR_48922_1 [Eumeta japonica]
MSKVSTARHHYARALMCGSRPRPLSRVKNLSTYSFFPESSLGARRGRRPGIPSAAFSSRPGSSECHLAMERSCKESPSKVERRT